MINEKIIRQMIAEEYKESNKIHPPLFTDLNHGYGVLHEEVKETMLDIEMIEALHDTIDNLVMLNDTEQLKRSLEGMSQRARHAIQELTQVAAMAEKFIDSIKAGEDDGIHTEKWEMLHMRQDVPEKGSKVGAVSRVPEDTETKRKQCKSFKTILREGEQRKACT